MDRWITRHERQVNGPFVSDSLFSETSDGRQVLNRYTLHILTSPSVDPPVFLDSGERVKLPPIRAHWNHIHVRVEQDRRQVRFLSDPRRNQNRPVGISFNELMFQSDILDQSCQERDGAIYTITSATKHE